MESDDKVPTGKGEQEPASQKTGCTSTEGIATGVLVLSSDCAIAYSILVTRNTQVMVGEAIRDPASAGNRSVSRSVEGSSW